MECVCSSGGAGSLASKNGTSAGPNELQAREDGNGGDNRLQFLRRNFSREQATEDDTGDAPCQELQKDGCTDGAERPMDGAADNGKHEAKENVRANNLRRAHLRVIQ